MCSTPVGIKDRFTRKSWFVENPRCCAQRLSASKIGSPGSKSFRARMSPCSTPVGIKDRFTRAWPDILPFLVVLNACRHQRSVHRQRQSSNAKFLNVLNACRHQRSVHMRHCKDTYRLSGAQRLSASKIGSPILLEKSRGRYDVLNACRHQRSVHLAGRFISNGHYTCSTPVGIKDRFTQGETPHREKLSSAQRLSASKIGSPTNAGSTGSYLGSAQRLSASKIGSHRKTGQ